MLIPNSLIVIQASGALDCGIESDTVTVTTVNPR